MNTLQPRFALYEQISLGADFDPMRKYAVKTLSLPQDVLRKGMERAAQFKMKFSHYIGHLIERDYASDTKRIVIVAEPKPAAEYHAPGQEGQ